MPDPATEKEKSVTAIYRIKHTFWTITTFKKEEEEEDEKIKQKIRNSRVYIITDFYVAAPLRSAPNIGSHYLPMLTTRRFVQGQASQRASLIDTGEGIIHHCRLVKERADLWNISAMMSPVVCLVGAMQCRCAARPLYAVIPIKE
jgi:hypothetical protein